MSGLSTKEKRAATKAELRQEIKQLRLIGAQMANLGFNLGQNARSDQAEAVHGRNLVSMYMLSRDWDAIPRAEK